MAKKKALGLESYDGARVIEVKGYLVIRTDDGAYTETLADMLEACNDGVWDIHELQEVSLTEVPNAKVTRSGIRTDLADEYAASEGPR